MSTSPAIVHEDERRWEGEDVAEHGNVHWRTLVSAGLTPSAVHSLRATGATDLRFAWAFATGSFEDVTYEYEGEELPNR